MARDRGRQTERKPANDDLLFALYSDLAAKGITGQAAMDAVQAMIDEEEEL